MTGRRYSAVKLLPTEASTLRAIRQALSFRGWRTYRIQQSLGSHRGFADLIAIKDAVTLFIEVKAPRGKLSSYQERFGAEITAGGGIYVVARSVEDIEKVITGIHLAIPGRDGRPAIALAMIKGQGWKADDNKR